MQTAHTLLPCPPQTQAGAILSYMNDGPTPPSTLLPTLDRQFAFITGSQDAVVPATTSVLAARKAKGAWLIQIPEEGHVSG
jgi:hypothetical protein